MNNRKTPRIRFRGFTDDWEQRKLGEIAPLRGGYAFKSESYTDSGIPIIRISNILSNGTVGDDFAYYDEQNEDEIYSLKNGSALLAMSGATTGKVSILKCKNTDKYYQNQRVGYFERKQEYDYGFVSTIVRSSLFIEQLTAVLVAGAQPNVSSKDIDSFDFFFPKCKEEQEKIGKYFLSIDHLITLHQRKLEKLKIVKKAMLENCFPKNGEKVPKFRFSGFTGDWEQRKLGDVLRTLPFKQFLKTPEQGGKYEIIQQGNEPIIGYANGEPCESFRNTVIFGDHTLSLYKPKKPFFVATDGVRILQGTNDMDGYYLLSLLEGNSLKSEGYKRYYSILLDREVLLTENHCEQVQIGLCFKHFDHLITLHQRKLEKLKIIKKSFLEKMFV